MTDRLDRTTADRLLAGDPDVGDVMPEVTALLRTATPTALRDPSAPLLAAMAAEARSAFDPVPAPTRSSSVFAKMLTAKVAAVAAVIAFTATGAAAATGSLPSAAQNGIARAASHVGVNLPDSADGHARDATEDLGPAEENHGTEVTDTVEETDQTGAEKGAAISDTAKADHGSTESNDVAPDEEHDAPTVDTPNHGAAADDVPSSDSAPVETPNDGAAADDAPPVDVPEPDAAAESEHEDGSVTAAHARAQHSSDG